MEQNPKGDRTGLESEPCHLTDVTLRNLNLFVSVFLMQDLVHNFRAQCKMKTEPVSILKCTCSFCFYSGMVKATDQEMTAIEKTVYYPQYLRVGKMCRTMTHRQHERRQRLGAERTQGRQ